MGRPAFFLSLTLACLGPVQAQSLASVDFTLQADLLPEQCRLMLSGGGVADFGRLELAAVRAWPLQGPAPARYASQGAGISRSLQLQVDCQAPAKFALSVIDNRPAGALAAADGLAFGLGDYRAPGGGPLPIGSYRVEAGELAIRSLPGAAPRAPARRLLTRGMAAGSSAWTVAMNDSALYLAPGSSLAFSADPQGTTPDALAGVAGPLRISLELLQSTLDAATSTVRLDGSATLTFIGL